MRYFRQSGQRRSNPFFTQKKQYKKCGGNGTKQQEMIENEGFALRFIQLGIYRRNTLKQAINPKKTECGAEV